MDINISLQQRNNVIKIQLLVHLQFSAERFKPMIKYAWFKSGYSNEKPETFQTPTQFFFKSNTNGKYCLSCLSEETQSNAFARCSHSEEYFCFNHFVGINPDVIDYHVCHG